MIRRSMALEFPKFARNEGDLGYDSQNPLCKFFFFFFFFFFVFRYLCFSFSNFFFHRWGIPKDIKLESKLEKEIDLIFSFMVDGCVKV